MPASASFHAVHLLLRGRAYHQLHTEASLKIGEWEGLVTTVLLVIVGLD